MEIASVLASACTDAVDDEGEVALANADNKGDSIDGRTLHYVVRGNWRWTASSGEKMVTATEVIQQIETAIRVRALRIIFDIRPREVFNVSIDNDAQAGVRIAFLLFTSPTDGVWLPKSCGGHNYFESVEIDPDRAVLDAVVWTPSGTVVRTYSYAECGIPRGTDQIALLAFPSTSSTKLGGWYEVTVRPTCNGIVCADASLP